MSNAMIIDGMRVPFTDEKNILAVIRNAGIDLPTFCYHSELSIYGACRMCSVEDKRGNIIASCSERPKDGMEVFTNTKKIQKYRKTILELLLSNCEHFYKSPVQQKTHKNLVEALLRQILYYQKNSEILLANLDPESELILNIPRVLPDRE